MTPDKGAAECVPTFPSLFLQILVAKRNYPSLFHTYYTVGL